MSNLVSIRQGYMSQNLDQTHLRFLQFILSPSKFRLSKKCVAGIIGLKYPMMVDRLFHKQEGWPIPGMDSPACRLDGDAIVNARLIFDGRDPLPDKYESLGFLSALPLTHEVMILRDSFALITDAFAGSGISLQERAELAEARVRKLEAEGISLRERAELAEAHVQDLGDRLASTQRELDGTRALTTGYIRDNRALKRQLDDLEPQTATLKDILPQYNRIPGLEARMAVLQ